MNPINHTKRYCVVWFTSSDDLSNKGKDNAEVLDDGLQFRHYQEFDDRDKAIEKAIEDKSKRRLLFDNKEKRYLDDEVEVAKGTKL